MRFTTGRAAVSFGPGRMEIREYPVLPPEPDQALIRVSMATICGSDLHALKHAELMVANSIEAGAAFVMDLGRDIVMGHEFCAEVLDYGPGTPKRFASGTRVVSMPLLVRGGGVRPRTPAGCGSKVSTAGESVRARASATASASTVW